MYKLIIEDDEGKKTVAPLIRSQITIGRAEGNAIRLTERNVSRKHARIWFEEEQIFVEDLESYNGIELNQTLVSGKVELLPGDLLRIGDYHLIIESDEEGDQEEARPSLPSDDPSEVTPPLGVPAAVLGNDATEDLSKLPPRLVIQNTDYAGEEFLVSKNEIQIGRTDDNAIFIDDPSVSRYHAILRKEKGVYKILDLESANGVRVNGEDFEECDLRWGDIIELGNVQMLFLAPGEATPPLPDQPLTPPPLPGQQSEVSGTMIPIVPVVAAVVVLLLGGFWFMRSSGKKKPNARKSPDAAQVVDAASQKLNSALEKQYGEARSAFVKEDYASALKILADILKKKADDKKAMTLQDKVYFEEEQQKHVISAKRKVKDGHLYRAYQVLGEVQERSRYFPSARSMRKELRPKAITNLMSKVQKSLSEKKYNEAIQFNAAILVLEPKHEEANAIHRRLQQLIQKAKNPPPDPRRDPVTPPDGRKPEPRRDVKKPAPDRRKAAPIKKRAVPPKKKKKLSPCEKLAGRGRVPARMKRKATYWARRCHKLLVKKAKKKQKASGHLQMGIITSKLGNCNVYGRDYVLELCEKSMFYYKKFLKLEPKGPRAAAVRKLLNQSSNKKPAPRR